MAIKTIVQPPSKFLTTVSIPAEPSRELAILLVNLKDTLEAQSDPKGVGLSAPQLAVSTRVFLIKPIESKSPTIFINPEIIKRSVQTTTKAENRKSLEGCLSLPDMYGEVARAAEIRVRYWTCGWEELKTNDFKNQLMKQEETLVGFVGRVFQHEFDHLEGILFPQRVLEQGGKLYQLEIEDGEEILVEVRI